MPTVTIQHPLKGITRSFTSTTSSFDGHPNEYSSSNGVDILRPGFEGHISPARVFDQTPVTSNINSLPRSSATDPSQSSPYVYLYTGGLSGTAPRWIRLISNAYDSSADVALTGAHSGHNFTTIPSSGTGFWGEDIVLYKVGTTNYLFYSYNDNTDGDVGQLTLSGTQTDNFMSGVAAGGAVLTGNVPHRMIEGDDKMLYITNGRYVSQFDGATGGNGTFTATKIDCGQGWIAVDLRLDKGLLVIVCAKMGAVYRTGDYSTPLRVSFWDYFAPGFGTPYAIDDGLVSSAFTADNILYLFTQGRNYTSKLRRFNGTRFEILKEWPVAVYGTIPQPNSIEFYQGQICWIPGDSTGDFVMSYDTVYGGLHANMIVNDGTNDATKAALLKNFYQNNLYVGALFAGTYKLAMSNNSSGYGAVSRDFRDIMRWIPFRSTLTNFRVFFSQMASGSSVQFSLFNNGTTASIGGATDLVNKTLDYATYGSLNDIEFINTIPNISQFYVNLRLTGQISITRVEIDYE